MALPVSMQENLMPSEVSFMAQNENITILPRYNMKKIELIGIKIPTLKSMRRQEVPLWVAIILKSQDKCNIVAPDWLSLSFLRKKYEEEVKTPHKFSDLPVSWVEVSKILLAKASDDLPEPAHQFKSILQDLREIRLAKSRKGLMELNESNIQLDGLSMMEINEIRPFVLTVMNQLRQLHETVSSEMQDDMQADDEEM